MFDKIKIYLAGSFLCLFLILSPFASASVFAAGGNQLLNYQRLTSINSVPLTVTSSDNGKTIIINYAAGSSSAESISELGVKFDITKYAGKTLSGIYSNLTVSPNANLSGNSFSFLYKEKGSDTYTRKDCGGQWGQVALPSDIEKAYLVLFCAKASRGSINLTNTYRSRFGEFMLFEGEGFMPWEEYIDDGSDPDPEPEPEPEPEPNPDPSPELTPKPDLDTSSSALSMFTPFIAFVVGLIDLITANEYLLFFLCFTLIGIGIGVLRKISDSLR